MRLRLLSGNAKCSPMSLPQQHLVKARELNQGKDLNYNHTKIGLFEKGFKVWYLENDHGVQALGSVKHIETMYFLNGTI